MTIMIVYITLRRRVSDVARKGFEKSTMDIRLQVWVRSAAIMSISFILLDEKRYDDREFYICETIPNEFWNLTSLWSIPISPVQLPGSSSTPYWESSLNTIEKSKPWIARLTIIWPLDESTPGSQRCGWAGPRWSPGRSCHRGRRGTVALPLNPPSGEVASASYGQKVTIVHSLSICERLKSQNCVRVFL